MDIEHWKTIDAYPDYEISSHGHVRNKKNNKEIKPWLTTIGYWYIRLQSNKNKPMAIHRLVAEAFVDKPIGYNNTFTVNHIDGVKTNNYCLNLEWLSYSGQQYDINQRSPDKTLPAKRHPVIGTRNDT